ncbi:MAG: phytanoyl-CoA dioxygenase family protein [Rhodospirillales bacterium]|jgi:ectoine hydroxylase-related dioxygenase (phytanoyl-CoA dioxygenase family)|nr:phytanoyl-CoA dioxygenase family protein [Rhodospirillales bacterium]
MHDSVPAPISDEMVVTYARDGVVCLRDILESAWIERMRRAVDRVTRSPGPMRESYYPDRPGDFFSEKFLWTFDADFRAYVFESPAAGAVAALLESQKLNIFFDQILVKEPGTDAPSPWHQDLNFWPFEGSQVASLWMPLDTVDLESGTLEFVRGSHLWHDQPMERALVFGKTDHQPAATAEEAGDEAAVPQPDIEADRGAYDIVTFELAPGDAVVFSALTLHSAPGNRSARRRRAISTRWTGDDVRYRRRPIMAELIRDPGLEPGDALDCELFPVVWRAAP